MVHSSKAQISEQNGSYRRGLILGLTMAEIVILIIFILLLALAALLEIEREKRFEAEQQLLFSEKRVTELTVQLSILNDVSGGDNIEEFVRELIVAREALRKAGNVQSRLAEARELIVQYEAAAREALRKTGDAQSRLAEARELIVQYEVATREALRKTGDVQSRLAEARELIAQYEAATREAHRKAGDVQSRLAEARELIVQYEAAAREALRKAGDVQSRLAEARELIAQYEAATREAGIPSTPEAVSRALIEARENEEALAEFGDMSGKEIAQESIEFRTENTRLEGQLANAQKKLKSLGKGNEMPSCWANADGTVEYIYEVAVSSNGMIVRKTDLPHREADRSLLPNSQLVQSLDVSSSEFNRMTRPIYQWSIEKKCRFYVKVYDLTEDTEKDIYKRRLKTVEGHFYRDFRIYKDF